MQKITIYLDRNRHAFAVNPMDVQTAPPEARGHIDSLITDLNQTTVGRRLGLPSYFMCFLIVLYLASFFLLFIRWYLVFVAVGLFILFIAANCWSQAIYTKFAREISRVVASHTAELEPFYFVKNKFLKGSSLRLKYQRIVLKPRRQIIVVTAQNAMVFDPTPIPIYNFTPNEPFKVGDVANFENKEQQPIVVTQPDLPLYQIPNVRGDVLLQPERDDPAFKHI